MCGNCVENGDIITCLAVLGCSCLELALKVSCLDAAALRHIIFAEGAVRGSLLATPGGVLAFCAVTIDSSLSTLPSSSCNMQAAAAASKPVFGAGDAIQ